MSAAEAERKSALFAAAERELPGADSAWFVPGRVELLGKHTDYAGGRSLLCAVERGFCVLARARPDTVVRVADAMSGSRVEFRLENPSPGAAQGWEAYPRAVVRRLVRDFGISRGMDLVFGSDLLAAAGLSSSTALCLGTFLALSRANDLGPSDAFRKAVPGLFELAEYLGAVENGKRYGPFAGDAGVGTLGGSQDQTAILCAIPGEVLQFRFDPVSFERRIPFPAGYTLVIGSSGATAEKSGAARAGYNAAALAVAEILRRWVEATGRNDRTLAAAVASAETARARLHLLIAGEPVLAARLRQFLAESEEIVPAAGEALACGDLEGLGVLVDRSQAEAETGLRNQTAETMQLARSARRLGAAAASAFGAGFGGSVWALVPTDEAEAFLEAWERSYLAAFPGMAGRAAFFPSPAGPSVVSF